jgi:hypothetical protein
MNQGIWRGTGGGGSLFWLYRETLIFKVPAAYQTTAVFQIVVNKILFTEFNTLRDNFMGHSASKG